MKYLLSLLFFLAPPLARASLIGVSDNYVPPVHYFNFTPQISVEDGYFRLLLPVTAGFPVPLLPAVSIVDQPGFTFAPPVSFVSGETGCTIPAGYHCFEFPYTGPGPGGTPLVISLEYPTSAPFPFTLRHYNSLGVMIDYTVASLSDPVGVQVTAVVSGTPTPSPFLFSVLPSLPATVARLTTREGIALFLPYLLALAILILIIFIWRRRFNLLILDAKTGQPIEHFIVYHSLPTTRRGLVLLTHHQPIFYQARKHDHGRLRIPRLARYSTLTIRTDSATYILSLSAKRRLYVISL